MERRFFRVFHRLSAWCCILGACGAVCAQSPASGPINLDRALQEDSPLEPDRATSYYHYSLGKWYEGNGDAAKALSEMRLALETNPTSSGIHYELAFLYARMGDVAEATRYAEEAVKLDAANPDPHWLLANIHLGAHARMRGDRSAPSPSAAPDENLRNAVREFEALEKLTPEDSRVYYSLGGAYFELGEPAKAIAAFEKYQKYAGSDAGYREIARYYEGIGDLDMAAEYLGKGLELQPESAETLMALGSIYLRQGKNKEAAPVFRKLLELSDGNARVMRYLAASLVEANEYEEAVKALEELAAKTRLDRTAQLLLGRSYLELGRLPEAVKTLKEVLAQVPYDMEARFYLGRAYEEGGQYKDASQIYEALVNDRDISEAGGNYALFQQRLGAAWLELGEYDKAIALYEEMAETDPKANFQLLNAYRASKRYDKGLALGKSMVAKNPEDIQLGIAYAWLLSEAGKGKAGAEHLSGLLQSHPENTDLYIYLSEIYREDRRFSDAEKVLLNGEGRVKGAAAVEQLKFQRAAIYERQKEYDRAETLFKEILDASPDDAKVLNYLGYMLADRGVRLDEAIRYIQGALKDNPRNGAYLDSLGWAYFKRNDLTNAEKYLLEASNFVKNDPTIHDHLGDLYFELGQLDKARDYWAESVRISEKNAGAGDRSADDVQKVRRKLNQAEESLRKRKPQK
ncbi:MAG: tetratricopeptide repeat protein [Acidobacteriota bacterium]|jgi:tetratricopeptide (TPR) repeat protein|nr:tetratricopeptide repeat protein [Acidobacteriota bacterium]